MKNHGVQLQNPHTCRLVSILPISFLTKLCYDLDLSPMNLDQGHDKGHGTSLGPV
jgi:hypothetical protein